MDRETAGSMTAAEIKDALRRRHPALDIPMIGAWTCIEEFDGIDLLAFSAWSSTKPSYGRVGYEVKVSRSDYRRELLRPHKRASAVAFCHEFYFAVPKGLLKTDEIAFEPPPELADPSSFVRERCPGYYGARCIQGDRRSGWVIEFGRAYGRYGTLGYRRPYCVTCPTCRGKGYIADSLAELIAPTLWIPADVGLVEIDENGCHLRKRAPRHKPELDVNDERLALIVRWVSAHPDPRHARLNGKAEGSALDVTVL